MRALVDKYIIDIIDVYMYMYVYIYAYVYIYIKARF